ESALLPGDGAVWYTWKAPAGGYVGISFSNFVIQNVGVFEGDSIATLTQVTRRFSGFFGNEIHAVADHTYRIAVSASTEHAGDFSMVIRLGLPRVSIKALAATVAETRTGQRLNTASFIVKRTGPTDHALWVNYFAFTSATNAATSGKDYVKLARSVKIAAGKSSAKIVVKPIDDRKVELTETVEMGLTSLHDEYVTMDSRALVEILDNERHSRARGEAGATMSRTSVFRKFGRIDR